MSKAVLLSIRPQYCELIASGKKTIEVRKTRPKIDTPFKCYIYETQEKCAVPQFVDEDGHYDYKGRGQVIGEFVCNSIYEAHYELISGRIGWLFGWNVKDDCLSYDEKDDYAGTNETLYGWHISDLVIYDAPKELCEFHHCGENYHYNPALTRPPQSWCYVEELR